MKSSVAQSQLFPVRNEALCHSTRLPSRPTRIGFHPARMKPAVQLAAVSDEKEPPIKKSPKSTIHSVNERSDPVRLFVGLPLDAVADRCGVSQTKAILAGLRALKLLGVHGVDLPVSRALERFDWSAHLLLASAVRDAGLSLRVSLDLDALTPLQPVDRVLDGFRSAFSRFIGSTVTDVNLSLSPDSRFVFNGHADRVLSLARKVFDEIPLRLSGRVPRLHNTWSGFHNGYEDVIDVFERNSCAMVLPEMETVTVTGRVMRACARRGVVVAGERYSLVERGNAGGFGGIKGMESFTYGRIGAAFFSPEHWPMFAEFARGLVDSPVGSATGNARDMQVV